MMHLVQALAARGMVAQVADCGGHCSLWLLIEGYLGLALPPPARVGPALSGALLSWLYALYCFDYKWALHGCPLHLRIRTLEQGWAFFLGEPSQMAARPHSARRPQPPAWRG